MTQSEFSRTKNDRRGDGRESQVNRDEMIQSIQKVKETEIEEAVKKKEMEVKSSQRLPLCLFANTN